MPNGLPYLVYLLWVNPLPPLSSRMSGELVDRLAEITLIFQVPFWFSHRLRQPKERNSSFGIQSKGNPTIVYALLHNSVHETEASSLALQPC